MERPTGKKREMVKKRAPVSARTKVQKRVGKRMQNKKVANFSYEKENIRGPNAFHQGKERVTSV